MNSCKCEDIDNESWADCNASELFVVGNWFASVDVPPYLSLAEFGRTFHHFLIARLSPLTLQKRTIALAWFKVETKHSEISDLVVLVSVSGGTDGTGGQVPQLPWVGEPDYGTGWSAEGGNLTVFKISDVICGKNPKYCNNRVFWSSKSIPCTYISCIFVFPIYFYLCKICFVMAFWKPNICWWFYQDVMCKLWTKTLKGPGISNFSAMWKLHIMKREPFASKFINHLEILIWDGLGIFLLRNKHDWTDNQLCCLMLDTSAFILQ